MKIQKIFLLCLGVVHCYAYKPWEVNTEKCFCQLSGKIDDCCCTVQEVEKLNSLYINTRINELTRRDYFRYFKLHLTRQCPFWSDWSQCAVKDCSVDKCIEDELPVALKNLKYGPKSENKYSMAANSAEDYPCAVSDDEHLGSLNRTISDNLKETFKEWNIYDADSSFCVYLDEDSDEAVWVDLLSNPEQYTGYQGRSAHLVWNSIYKENCFLPAKKIKSYDEFNSRYLSKTCLEKRVFFRVVSGLHASINIHLSYHYPVNKKFPTKPKMAPHSEEFHKRFHPETTKGQGPYWLKNLYFTYLLLLRAVIKAAPYWKNVEFYTGNPKEDLELKKVILDVVKASKTCPSTFDESQMFTGDPRKAQELKEEFRLHFKNITRIMDCVGCERCRLWGKLQTTGLGTALKILFSSDKWDDVPIINGKRFALTRTEIVALFNSLCKLSDSLVYLNEFKMNINHKKSSMIF